MTLDLLLSFLDAFYPWSPLTIFLKISCFSVKDLYFFFKLTIFAACFIKSVDGLTLFCFPLDWLAVKALFLTIFLFFLTALFAFYIYIALLLSSRSISLSELSCLIFPISVQLYQSKVVIIISLNLKILLKLYKRMYFKLLLIIYLTVCYSLWLT